MTVSERLLEKLLARQVTKGTLTLVHSGGARRTFGTPAPGFPDVAIRFCDGRVARDIFTDMRLGFAEAFVDGRILIERGEVMDVVALLRMNNRWEDGRKLAEPSLASRLKNRFGHFAHSFNRPGKAKRNVARHYDIGNDLYRLMLDEEHMQYSCAYWPTGPAGDSMTLGQAQEAKLAHIAAKLNLAPGDRVLDIGCGWGGMAIYLAKAAGAQVLGITLSEEQLALARARAEAAGVAGQVRFELVDYRDLAARGASFDRIVSVGMFEHVGVPQYPTFFRACARMLAEDGAMLLHTIGRMGSPGAHRRLYRQDTFSPAAISPR